MAFRLLKVTPNVARMMSTNATTVGFIGLGQMGNRMATNLINKVLESQKAGFDLVTSPHSILVSIEHQNGRFDSFDVFIESLQAIIFQDSYLLSTFL